MTYTYEFPRPAVTVDVAAFRPGPCGPEILLVRRGKPPFQGRWALPGGFLDLGEELEDAARRELREETGLEVEHLEQIGAFGRIGRDPRGRTITIVYGAFAPAGAEVRGGDDADEARWFSLGALPPLAFDHDEIVRRAAEWWRSVRRDHDEGPWDTRS